MSGRERRGDADDDADGHQPGVIEDNHQQHAAPLRAERHPDPARDATRFRP
jgi:hypothetical protein